MCTSILTYPVVGQGIAEALCAEERGDGPALCYGRYLSSLRDIFDLLKQELSVCENQWPLDDTLSQRHVKFLGLAQRCLDRTVDQLNTSPNVNNEFSSLPAIPSQNVSPAAPNRSPKRVSPVNEPVRKHVESKRINFGIESPMETAARKNRALIASFQLRIQSGRFTSSQLSQLNLSLQRNLSENTSIARSKEDSFGRRIEAKLSDQLISIETNRQQYPDLFNDLNMFSLYKSSAQYEFHFLSQDTWFQRCKSSRRDALLLSFGYLLRLSEHPLQDTLNSFVNNYILRLSEIPTKSLSLDTFPFTQLAQSLMSDLDKISKIFSLLLSGDASSTVLRDPLLRYVLPGRLYPAFIDYLSTTLRDPLIYLQEQMNLPLEQKIEQIGLKLKYAFLGDPSAYESVVQELVAMITPVLPSEKLSSLNVAVTSLVHYVRDRMPEGDKGVGADELLPILCYVLLLSRQPILLIHCKLLEGLAFDDQLDGAEGYTLTTFITAATFCASRPSEQSD